MSDNNPDQMPLAIDEQRTLAWNLYQELQSAIKNQIGLFLLVGRMLRDIRDQHLYKYMGEGGNDTFNQFLNGLGFSQPTAYLYIRVFEFYVEKLKMPEEKILDIPLNRLMRLLPVLKKMDSEDAKKLIEEMGPLTANDYAKSSEEKKLEVSRPKLYRDKECGKFRFEFDPDQMCHCNPIEGGEPTTGIVDRSLLD